MRFFFTWKGERHELSEMTSSLPIGTKLVDPVHGLECIITGYTADMLDPDVEVKVQWISEPM